MKDGETMSVKQQAIAAIRRKYLARLKAAPAVHEAIVDALGAAYDTGSKGPEALTLSADASHRAQRAEYLRGFKEAREQAIALAENAAARFEEQLRCPSSYRWNPMGLSVAKSTLAELEAELPQREYESAFGEVES